MEAVLTLALKAAITPIKKALAWLLSCETEKSEEELKTKQNIVLSIGSFNFIHCVFFEPSVV